MTKGKEMNKLVKHFNDTVRNDLWEKNGKDYKETFHIALGAIKSAVDDNASEKLLNQMMDRLVIGYYGIGKQGGLTSGIETKATLNLKYNQYTRDHLFGATEIGKHIRKVFEENNWDRNYMVNAWLYENLWLWMTINVTKTEHKKDNIIRNQHTIEEKLELKHYINISEIILK